MPPSSKSRSRTRSSSTSPNRRPQPYISIAINLYFPGVLSMTLATSALVRTTGRRFGLLDLTVHGSSPTSKCRTLLHMNSRAFNAWLN